jgi:hypothetical protein
VAGALVLAAYARSFGVPFQFDDLDQIVDNPVLRLRTFAEIAGWGRARIIPYGSFVLNFVAGELDPFGYHAVNLLIHLVSTWLVFEIALLFCRTPRLRHTALAEQALSFAFIAALLFGVHPIQVQAVTYVSQRVASMAAMFYLAATYFYMLAAVRRDGEPPARSGSVHAAAAVMALAAFLSKENAASLPFALLLVEIVCFGRQGVARAVKSLPIFAGLALLIPGVWLVLWQPRKMAPPRDLWEQFERVIAAVRPAGAPVISAADYFLTQCTVLPRYLQLVAYPSGLNLDHDVEIQQGLSTAVTLGFTFLALLFLASVWAIRRHPAIGFAVLWFFVTSSVESTFLAIADPMMEHRMYLPMAGLCLGAASIFVALRPHIGRLAPILAGTAVAALTATTIARNELWRDPLTLWLDSLSKAPNKARVNANVGFTLLGRGQTEESIPYFCRALDRDPGNAAITRGLYSALDARIEKIVDSGQGYELLEFTRDEDGNVMMEAKNPCK